MNEMASQLLMKINALTGFSGKDVPVQNSPLSLKWQIYMPPGRLLSCALDMTYLSCTLLLRIQGKWGIERKIYHKANCSLFTTGLFECLGSTETHPLGQSFQAIQLFPGNLNLGPILKKMLLEDCHSCPYIKIGQAPLGVFKMKNTDFSLPFSIP